MNSAEQLMHTFLNKVVGEGDLELIQEIAHPDMVDEANVVFGGPPGREGLVAHVKGFRRNIKNPALTIHRIVGNESEVMAWWSVEGLHVGPWLDQTPTQNVIAATVFSFFNLSGGRIQRYQLWLKADFDPAIVFDGRITPATV